MDKKYNCKFLRNFLIVIPCILSVYASSQVYENDFYLHLRDSNWNKKYVSISSSFFASPSSRLDLLNFFLLLQYTGSLKDEVSGKLHDRNYFGVYINNDLTAAVPVKNILGKGSAYLTFRVQNDFWQSVYFTKDFYRLLFYGNNEFAGRSAECSPFEYLNVNYQSFEMGLNKISTIGKGRQILWGVNLSAIKGATLSKINAGRANLYTSGKGDSIYLDFKFNYNHSDPSAENWYNYNGTGFKFGGYLLYHFNKSKSLYFSVSDLGMISWNNKTYSTSFDTSTSFTGFDLLNNDFQNKKFILDTFSNLSESGKQGSYNEILSPRIGLIYSFNLRQSRKQMNAGIFYTFTNHLTPAVFLNVDLPVNKSFRVQPGVIFDQFQKAGVNIELTADIRHKWLFTAGTYHLEEIFSLLNGESFYFCFSRKL